MRGYDSSGPGNWATERNFTIPSVININLTRENISFGNISVSGTDETRDNSPLPMLLVNLGNVLTKITSYATASIFTQASINSTYFQYAAANASEGRTFDAALSQIQYINVTGPAITNATTLIRKLNWTNSNDTAEIDFNLTVPIGEPPGGKSATIFVVGVIDE